MSRHSSAPSRSTAQVSNERAQPFVWTKDAESILRKVRKIQRLSVTAH